MCIFSTIYSHTQFEFERRVHLKHGIDSCYETNVSLPIIVSLLVFVLCFFLFYRSVSVLILESLETIFQTGTGIILTVQGIPKPRQSFNDRYSRKSTKPASISRAKFNMGFRGHWLKTKCQYAGFESMRSYSQHSGQVLLVIQ